MKIRFTVTLSDATVAAFNRAGYASGITIKDRLVEALQEELDNVLQEGDVEDEESDLDPVDMMMAGDYDGAIRAYQHVMATAGDPLGVCASQIAECRRRKQANTP